MKPIKRITQFFLIILTGAAINIHSSTTDEPAAEPTKQGEQVNQQSKVPSLQELTRNRLDEMLHTPRFIKNTKNKIMHLLDNDHLDEAVDYVTELPLDENTLIEILNNVYSRGQKKTAEVNAANFFIKTIISKPQLQNNVAIEHIKSSLKIILLDMEYANFRYNYQPGRNLIDKLIGKLVDAGVSFDNDLGASLLYVAAITKHNSLIKILIEAAKLNVDLISDHGTALMAAVKAGNLPGVQYLLEHNADPLLEIGHLNSLYLAKTQVQIVKNTGLEWEDDETYQANVTNAEKIYELVAAAADQQKSSPSTRQASSTDQG